MLGKKNDRSYKRIHLILGRLAKLLVEGLWSQSENISLVPKDEF